MQGLLQFYTEVAFTTLKLVINTANLAALDALEQIRNIYPHSFLLPLITSVWDYELIDPSSQAPRPPTQKFMNPKTGTIN
jgi:hypothetical protein